MDTAQKILWLGAGKPIAIECIAIKGLHLCWWCGDWVRVCGRPTSSIPDSFPAPQRAAKPASLYLCAACAWSLSDHISLPSRVAADRLRMKAANGRRALVTIPRLGAGKRIILTLADGKIGVWESPTGISALDGATDDNGNLIALDELRTNPRNVKGLYKGRCPPVDSTCKYLGSWDASEVSEGESDDAGTSVGAEKFRAYHHLGTASEWIPCTDSQKLLIRDFLLNPPSDPWVAVIGDAKKHAAIFSRPSPGGEIGATVRLRDDQIDYSPAALREAVSAAVQLASLGATEEDLRTGRYTARPSLDLLVAAKKLDRSIAPLRGTSSIDLLIYLYRAKEAPTDGDNADQDRT